MALSNREQKILQLTIVVVGGVLLWWGVAPIWDNYVQLKEDLEAEKATFNKNKKILQRTEEIEEEFRRVEAQFPDVEEGRSPDFAFSEDVAAAVESILPGERRPAIQPPKSEPIKNVDDYEFLNLVMDVSGQYEKLAQLLKGFDQKGFLVKSITLDHSNPDKPELSLNITLARIVKLEDEEPDGGARRGFRTGRRI